MPQTSRYQMQTYRNDSTDFVKISGNLIMTNFEEIYGQLEEVVKTENTEIYVDLNELKMMDSTGLGMLVQLNMRLKGLDKKLTLLRPQPSIQRLFSLAKIPLLILVISGIDAEDICEKMESPENLLEVADKPKPDPITT